MEYSNLGKSTRPRLERYDLANKFVELVSQSVACRNPSANDEFHMYPNNVILL